MSLVTRKPVFGVFDQVRHKPACSATETSQSLEIANVETRDIILSSQRTTKALIRLRGCTGWSAPLLFAYGISRFSHDVAQFLSTYSQYYTVLFPIWTKLSKGDKIKCILWVYGKSYLVLASCTSYYCKQLWHQQHSVNISIVLHIIFEIRIILQTSISENWIFEPRHDKTNTMSVRPAKT